MQTARDLIHGDTVTVAAHQTLPEILHLFVVAGIGGAPVVRPGGAVIGIVTSTDVMRAIEQALDEDSDTGESDDLRESLQMITAGDIASPDVVWIAADTTVAQLSQIMRANRIHHALVGSSEKLEGIVTSFDMLGVVDASS